MQELVTSETKGALDTLKEISPVAYVLLVLGVPVLIYIFRLYLKEKTLKEEQMELRLTDFKDFSHDHITLSKDVMNLVKKSADETKVTSVSNSAKLDEIYKIIVDVEHSVGTIEKKIG